jgi:hypothetical protein
MTTIKENANTLTNAPAAILSLFEAAADICNDNQVLESAQDLENFEQQVHNLTAQLQAVLVENKIQQSLDSEQLKDQSADLIKSIPRKTKNNGPRDVYIMTESGIIVKVTVVYYTTKKKGRGKKRNAGLYPGLLLLGIYDRCTPGLISEIGQTVAALGSFEEAQQALANQGVVLDVKTISDIAYRMAARARQLQHADAATYGDNLQGQRVVISTDGGRVRIRKNKRGPKTKKGRTRYHSKWREPKILVIYVTDENGRRNKSFCPFIDGLIQGPDAVFALISHYLGKLNITQAAKVLFVADGAPWIWDRARQLMVSLGLKAGQFYELLDFYHAVEHLSVVASLRKKLNGKKRKQWVTQQRKLLLDGKIDTVIDTIKSFCKGRNSGKIRTQLNYFIKHRDRMQYELMAKLGLPLGSGAIESAVRRVVNLRLKGPGIFWKHKNAEAILLLRSYFKAGRWNLLKNMANSLDNLAIS